MKFPLLPAMCVAVAVWFSSPVSAVAQTTIYTSAAMSGAVGNESLGFTPLSGNIYTLSFSLLNSNVDENLVIGFATSTTPGDSFADAWWNTVRANRADGNYAAPYAAGAQGSPLDLGDKLTTNAYQIVLNTANPAAWTSTTSFNGNESRVLNLGDPANIVAVNSWVHAGSAGAVLSNFSLTSSPIPEPGTYALAAVGFLLALAAIHSRRVRAT
jgi:hypothetical protein